MAKEVSKTCRTCLGNNVELVSIYNGDDNSVVEMLEYILDRQLEVTDELPKTVCHECFNDISRCYSFKRKCNNSFKILSNQLDNRKNLSEVLMQIKVEPEVNISGEFFESENETQKTLDVSHQNFAYVELGEMSIKNEPTSIKPAIHLNERTVNAFDKNNTVRQLNRNEKATDHLRLHDKEILPTTTIASKSNTKFDSSHNECLEEQNANDIHMVQYLIRELKEERDSVDELFELEVNIRHCASCGSGFAQDADFKQHMRNCGQSKKTNVIQRSPSKKHFCPYCEKVFPRPCRLKNHLRKHHQEIVAKKLKEPAQVKQNPHQHMCPHCDLSFNLESSLKYHLSSHTKETQFNRSFSEQSLKNKLVLNRHLTNHTNPKKHKCKVLSRI